MSRFLRVSIGALVALLAACGQPAGVQVASPRSPQPTPPSSISPVSGPSQPARNAPGSSQTTPTVSGWPAGADPAVRAAIKDLAARLKVTPETVQVISVSAADWSDTSLGCPQPGMFYAQVIVSGYKIVLSASGTRAEYHSDQRDRVVTCSR